MYIGNKIVQLHAATKCYKWKSTDAEEDCAVLEISEVKGHIIAAGVLDFLFINVDELLEPVELDRLVRGLL
jgi:hypothetical protein